MSQEDRAPVGSIGWVDLTVADADAVRDFYRGVIGWGETPVSMGDYNDYCMTLPQDDKAVAGVCHARGGNAGLPAVWLVYLTVEDLDRSLATCLDTGGSVIAGPKDMGPQGRYAVIRDPAGAAVALFQAAPESD